MIKVPYFDLFCGKYLHLEILVALTSPEPEVYIFENNSMILN